ncbi:MAG: hypothetical protein HYU39_05500 [Thaumarchaeota archaeon]|nr:hypothetical protein [Nitrososphaerota archaeon]
MRRKVKVVNEDEELVFDNCFQRYSIHIGPKNPSRISGKIARLVRKYNP